MALPSSNIEVAFTRLKILAITSLNTYIFGKPGNIDTDIYFYYERLKNHTCHFAFE